MSCFTSLFSASSDAAMASYGGTENGGTGPGYKEGHSDVEDEEDDDDDDQREILDEEKTR